MHRRGFFTQGLRQLFKPLAKMVEERLEHVGLPDWDDHSPSSASRPAGAAGRPVSTSLPADRPLLRPPGALPEEEFLSTCISSGRCIHSCPVSAIQWGYSDDPSRDRKPFIDVRRQACVVCEHLACMNACPSGALKLVAKEEIRMGLAQLRDDVCVRTQGEDCQICVDKCPLGSTAIAIPYYGAPVEVREPGCVGCGVCEMYCPTEPKAIVVALRPAAAGEGSGLPAGPEGYMPPD